MVLGYNAAYSSKVKNIARECTRIHLLHMTVKKISGEGDSPVLKLPLVGGVYHAPTASHLPQTWGPVFFCSLCGNPIRYYLRQFATWTLRSLPGRFATWTFRTFGRFDSRTFRYLSGLFATCFKACNLR